MNWDFMVALVLAIPVFVFPAFLWYLDIGGSYGALWKGRKRRDVRAVSEWKGKAVGRTGRHEPVLPWAQNR